MMSYHKNKMLCRMVSQFSRHDIGPRYDGAKKLLHGFLLKGRRWIACAHVTSCTCVTVAKACSSFIHLNPFSSSDFEKTSKTLNNEYIYNKERTCRSIAFSQKKQKQRQKAPLGRFLPSCLEFFLNIFSRFFCSLPRVSADSPQTCL